MNSYDEFQFVGSTDGSESGGGSPPENSGGVSAVFDDLLRQLPGIIDSWRKPATAPRPITTTTPAYGQNGNNTLLLVVLIAGLVWAVS